MSMIMTLSRMIILENVFLIAVTFFTDINKKLVLTKQTHWFPIVYNKKQIGQFEVESQLDLNKG